MTVHVSKDPTTSETTIEFSLDHLDADEVSVVGSFNSWSPGVDPLMAGDGGRYTATVTVPSTQDVHFRYLDSNGTWFDDPDADEVTPDGCVLHLAPASSATPFDAPLDELGGDDIGEHATAPQAATVTLSTPAATLSTSSAADDPED